MTTDELVVGLGANLGAPDEIVARFRDVVARLRQLGPVRASSVYASAALTAGDPDFLNAAVAVRLVEEWDPDRVLAYLHALEAAHGRDRGRERRWGPRPLDLDVLMWGPRIIATPTLTVPHPRLRQRSFALRPVIELVGATARLPGDDRALVEWAATAGPAITVTHHRVALD